MSLLNPLPVFLLTALVAIFMSMLIRWEGRGPIPQGRFSSIDGLRGYLALFVFLHHASIWFTFAGTGAWHLPPSNFYSQLGQSSVSLFFMITSFLFYNKLLESRSTTFGWRAFFIGRFFRLTPLYLAAMVVLFVIVAVLSKGELIDSAKYVIRCAVEWLTFTIYDAPNINRIAATRIVAGVTWSLPYEWIFYCSLPLLAVTAGHRVHWRLLVLAVAALSLGAFLRMQPQIAMMFAGGVVAGLLVRHAGFRQFAVTGVASALALAALGAMLFFRGAYGPVQLLLLTAAFCLIACGANLFGVLHAESSRRLGDLAYSIYLLHGILLFVTLHFVVGKANVAAMLPVHYWIIIAALVPLLLGLSVLTFRYIEMPGIAMTRMVVKRMQARSKALKTV